MTIEIMTLKFVSSDANSDEQRVRLSFETQEQYYFSFDPMSDLIFPLIRLTLIRSVVLMSCSPSLKIITNFAISLTTN